jgi:hypothetical protein
MNTAALARLANLERLVELRWPADPEDDAEVAASQQRSGIEIAGPLESDGTLQVRVAADSIGALRDAWSGICSLHEEVMGKASPVNPAVACEIKSRKLAFDVKQRALKHADSALAELRVATKEVEAAVVRKATPARMREDVAGAILAGEVRSWVRSHPDRERMRLVETAIGAGDAKVVVPCLEMPEGGGW